jgi:hypothetical protein
MLATALVYAKMRLQVIWRILLGAGSLPGMVLLFLQYRVLFYRSPAEEPVETIALREESAPNEANPEEGQINDEDPLTPEQGEVSVEEQARNHSTEISHPVSSPAQSSHSNDDDLSPRQHSQRTQESRQLEENATGMNDRELDADSDGEVGTFLDSSPDMDMSSAGVFRESEPPVINAGWLVSLQTEERLGQKLMGTAVTWFLFDVLFYGNTLFQPIVIEKVFGSREYLDGHALIRRLACDSLILNSISLPGYIIAGVLIGKKTCGIKQSPRCK